MNIGIYVHRRDRRTSLRLLRELTSRGHTVRRFTPTSHTNRGINVWDMDVLVNYGCSVPPRYALLADMQYLNTPDIVALTSDKVRWFTESVVKQTVPWTTDPAVARSWLDSGARVAVRTLTRASQGRGMTVLHQGDDVPPAPLYTKLIRGPRVREFRVLVSGGRPIHWKRKRRRNGYEYEGDRAYIRSEHNGWVYTIENVLTDASAEQSIKSAVLQDVSSMFLNQQLDIGAYDFLADLDSGAVWGLECNSAPGLTSPSSMDAMIQAITNGGYPNG